eukprot:Hpha_TRINITY_DN15954_c1_g11::TRINITY_DN15954_c1_g11_i1::g.75616::m.75616
MYGPNEDPNRADPPLPALVPPDASGENPTPRPAAEASPPASPVFFSGGGFRTRRLQALLDRESAVGKEAQEAKKQLAEVARLKGELGTLHRLQVQLELVKSENAQLRRLLNRGMEAVEREHSERSLEYDNVAKEKCDLEERLKEAVQEVECHQADVRLAFDEANRVGLQNLHLLKVLDQKEAALEQLRGQLALSDHAHRRTLDLLDQSAKQSVGVGKQRVDAAQDCNRLREKLSQAHARGWRMEQEKEALQSEVQSLRSQVSGLQRQVALQSAWSGGQIPTELPPESPTIETETPRDGAKSAAPWHTSQFPSGMRSASVPPPASKTGRRGDRSQGGLPNIRNAPSVTGTVEKVRKHAPPLTPAAVSTASVGKPLPRVI